MSEKTTKYVCPETNSALKKEYDDTSGALLRLKNKKGGSYPVVEGIPDLTYPQTLSEPDKKARDFYEGRADAYDQHLHLTFKTHNEDETKVRNEFVDSLEISERDRVLDLACGTGRDSEIIAQRLGKQGELYCQDISFDMLRRCSERVKETKPTTNVLLANACFLPFADDFFDAVYSFGALGEFSDIRKSLAEMVRVTKTGGKIVVGDESIPPWLRGTKFAKILTKTNPQFTAEVPLDDIPVEAREVCIRWVIGGVFYLVDFRVGEGEPDGNFDFPIPGFRGGTYRTRYEGELEGVTPETKELYKEAAKASGKSLHEWLDEVVKTAAKEELRKG